MQVSDAHGPLAHRSQPASAPRLEQRKPQGGLDFVMIRRRTTFVTAAASALETLGFSDAALSVASFLATNVANVASSISSIVFITTAPFEVSMTPAATRAWRGVMCWTGWSSGTRGGEPGSSTRGEGVCEPYASPPYHEAERPQELQYGWWWNGGYSDIVPDPRAACDHSRPPESHVCNDE